MAQVRPMRADARRNHERLLTVAAEAFAEHGEGASLDDIAKRAGVGSGTLYRHFPTRQALLEAAYLERVEAIAARAGVLAEELPPGEALGEWLYELGAGMIRMRGLKALLGPAVTDSGSLVNTACGDSVRAAAGRLVRAAQAEGTLRADVEPGDVLRLAHGMATASELADGEDRHLRRYLTLLMEGLGPGRRGRGAPDAPWVRGRPRRPVAGYSACAAGFTMPLTVRDFTKSPMAVISHSPENWRMSLAIRTPVWGSAPVRSKRTSSSPVVPSRRRQ